MFKKIFYIILFYIIPFSFGKNFLFINKEIEKSEISEVKSINIKSYEEYANYLKNNSYIISLFHVHWCGHCQKLKPILDKASSYNILNKKWLFLKVDCSSYSYICSIMNVQMYPTINIYKDKKLLYKEPPRELLPLIQFLYKISDNPIINITSKNKFLDKYGEHSPIIEYNKENNNTEFINCINKLANNELLEDFYFGIDELKYGKESINLSDIIYEWNGNCTEALYFLYENKYPILNEMDSYLLQDISKDFKTVIFVVGSLQNKIFTDFIFSSLKNLSYNNRKYVFGYSDYDSELEIKNFFNFKLNNVNEMKLIIYDFNKRMYYMHETLFNFKTQNESIIINEIKNIIDNIKKLKFTSGSKFRDIFSFINFEEMSPYKQIVVVGIFVIILLIIIYFLFSFSNDENIQEDEFEDFIEDFAENISKNKDNDNLNQNKMNSEKTEKQKIE